MKNNIYIKQIYEEGLGTSFYQKPKNFINDHIKNNTLKKGIFIILEIVYIVFIIGLLILLFNLNFPL